MSACVWAATALLAACGGDDGNDPQATPTTVEAGCYYDWKDYRGHPFMDCSTFSGPERRLSRFFAMCDTIADRCESTNRTCKHDFEIAACDFTRCGSPIECTPDVSTCVTLP
ncbi:MAG: hypothetical protein U1E86_28970 [Burkholderiaceae bacterium]